MKDALRLVKLELGDDAIILKSRKVVKGGALSFLAKEQIEITAAVDYQMPEPSARKTDDTTKRHSTDDDKRSDKYLLFTIRDDVERIDGTLKEIGDKLKYDSIPGLPVELNRYYVEMVAKGVEKQLAGTIIQDVYSKLHNDDCDDSLKVATAVQSCLRTIFLISGPFNIDSGAPNVVALIGPTGVGKTTTIAKIASQYKFFAGKKIALISADTYRMAAIEQLRTFARIASIPLEVVYQPQDMRPAILKHQDKDLIIIDTAGRSHKDAEKMKELNAFMKAAQPDEIHLTLSAGTKFSDLIEIVDRFRAVQSDYFIFTKLDETSNFGNLLNLAYHRPKPFSMLTLGQNVPDDIALANKAGLAKLILSKSLEEAAINKGLHAGSSAQTARAGIS